MLTILIGMECDRKHKFVANLYFHNLKNILYIDFKKNKIFTRCEKKLKISFKIRYIWFKIRGHQFIKVVKTF